MTKNLEQAKITPMAYTKDFQGIIFIIKIERNGQSTYARVFPPDYNIKEESNEGLLLSAVTKHNYQYLSAKVSFIYNERKNKFKEFAEKLK